MGISRTKYKKSFLPVIVNLVLQNKTLPEVAENIAGVSAATLRRWMEDEPELAASVKEARAAKLTEALYKRAVGYEFQEKRARKITAGKKEITTVTEVITKQQPPDVNALQLLLKHEQPEQWNDKLEVAHSGGIVLQVNPLAMIDEPPAHIENEYITYSETE
ncbi:hypothetical protein FACS189419_04800 [Planctomycetales bacterium]|nr:hypothetical protein FACS189419_04800 [Planctomycetales bacterium]